MLVQREWDRPRGGTGSTVPRRQCPDGRDGARPQAVVSSSGERFSAPRHRSGWPQGRWARRTAGGQRRWLTGREFMSFAGARWRPGPGPCAPASTSASYPQPRRASRPASASLEGGRRRAWSRRSTTMGSEDRQRPRARRPWRERAGPVPRRRSGPGPPACHRPFHVAPSSPEPSVSTYRRIPAAGATPRVARPAHRQHSVVARPSQLVFLAPGSTRSPVERYARLRGVAGGGGSPTSHRTPTRLVSTTGGIVDGSTCFRSVADLVEEDSTTRMLGRRFLPQARSYGHGRQRTGRRKGHKNDTDQTPEQPLPRREPRRTDTHRA